MRNIWLAAFTALLVLFGTASANSLVVSYNFSAGNATHFFDASGNGYNALKSVDYLYNESADSYDYNPDTCDGFPDSGVNLTDGDWNTFSQPDPTAFLFSGCVQMNYTIPSGAIGAIWQVKNEVNGTFNVTIPQAYFDAQVADDGKLKFFFMALQDGTDLSRGYALSNPITYPLMVGDIVFNTEGIGNASRVYEEAVYWIMPHNFSATGVRGDGAVFDGNTAELKVPALTVGDNWTVSVLFKPAPISNENIFNTIWGYGYDSNAGTIGWVDYYGGGVGFSDYLEYYGDIIDPNSDYAYTWSGYGYIPFNTTKWYNLVMTYNGTSLRMYINGSWVEGGGDTPNGRNNSWYEKALTIGNTTYPLPAGWTSRLFNGTMDEFKIYDYALSDAEVKSLYLRDGPPQLMVDYNFSATNGTHFLDASGNGNNGEMVGNWAGNGTGEAEFNGVDSQVLIPDIGIGNVYSVGLWVRFASLPTINGESMDIWGYDWVENSSGMLYLYNDVADDNYTFYYDSGDGNYQTATRQYTEAELLDNWIYLTISYNGTDACLYHNGICEPTSPPSNGRQPFILTTLTGYPSALGIPANGVINNPFNGTMDDFKIWNYALNDTQVAAEYAAGRTFVTQCSEDGICLRYDGSGNSTHLYDASGNGNDGIIQGNIVKHTGYFDLYGAGGTVMTPNLTIIGTDWTIQTWVKFNNLTCDVGSPQNFITAYQSQQPPAETSKFGTLQAYCDGLGTDGWDGYVETWNTLGGGISPYSVSLFNTTELVGKWALVTLTSNATAEYMYFNNRSFYQPYQESNTTPNAFSNIPITLGNSTIPLSEVLIPYYDAFNGSIGNFTIYNYAKNESQIATDFATGNPYYNPIPTPIPFTPSESNYATARFIVGNSLAVFTLFSSWQGLIVLTIVGGVILSLTGGLFGSRLGSGETE